MPLIKRFQLTDREVHGVIDEKSKANWYIDLCVKNESANNDQVEDNADKLQCYVLIDREHLDIVRSGIQAAHAAIDLVFQYGRTNDAVSLWAKKHKTLIFLAADNPSIDTLVAYFDRYKKVSMPFIEPDIGNLRTAVAFEPISKADGDVLFSKFKLLSTFQPNFRIK